MAFYLEIIKKLMSKDILISIIIPTFNEERRVSSTLRKVREYFSNKNFQYEVVVVDDGSTDNTVTVVEKESLYFENFIFIENIKNMGKGYSVKKGMLEASGELKLFMDADSSVDIKTLDSFVKYIKSGADIIIGSIEVPGSSIKDDNLGYRRLFGRYSKIIIRTLATPGIYDTQRGFKLFTKQAADTVFKRQTIDRWGFDIEIIVIAQCNNLNIREVPVDWKNSKASSVHIGSYFVTFVELLAIKLNSLLGKYA